MISPVFFRSLENAQFIHHISAHVVTGGPLTEEEQSLADVLLPEKVWDYNCCRIDETDSVPGFTWSRLAEHSVEVRRLFFILLLKDPQININNVICASQLYGISEDRAEWSLRQRSATTVGSLRILTVSSRRVKSRKQINT